MSADSQRLKSALRRIVLESPELRELLGDSDNRGDQAGSAGVGTSDAEESRLCCDGSTSDNANPGTDERDADADSQDGLDPDDPADLNSGDGTLSGVTDCATGEPICFDGSGFIPPDGWDEPDEPPIIDSYEEGTYFYGQYEGDITSPSPIVVGDTICARWLEEASSRQSCEVVKVTDDLYEVEGEDAFIFGTIEIRDVTRRSCDTDPDPACNEDPPTEDTWPSDGCTNLAIVNGSIVGSKYDPENDGSYSAPRDEIQLCSGGEQIGLKPAANGGWKTINATSNSGYLWDSHGNKIAHIDGNEYSDPDV